MHIRFLFLVLFCLPITTLATTLHGEARAMNKDEAQRQALSDLANSIFVRVQSDSFSRVEGSGKRQDEINIKSSSDIPLIGADIQCDPAGAEVVCKVNLDSSKSLALYSRKLNELLLEIGTLDGRIAKASGEGLYVLLTQALTVIEQYEKHRAVAQMLGETNFTAPKRSRADTETQLRELEKAAPTLELAAQLLTKGLRTKAVYIYPALAHGSDSVTQFASVLRDQLAAKLSSVNSPDKARTFFRGEYEILDNGIQLTYRLSDSDGNTVDMRLAKLAPAAYKGLQVKPTTMSLEKLINAGYGESSDFRAQLSTRKGGEALLFNEHEEIELLVKLNHPGYFYVVGHVLKKAENYSYLVELEEANNEQRFVRYVGPEDVNRLLSIGKFAVTAPFGVDSLQLIASKNDPLKTNDLPPSQLDGKTGMYVIATSVKEGITKTRGILFKKSAEYKAVANLTFTTMAKK
ncbi:MAG: hypothetical protein WCI39_08240 [Gallionellaceae bacterium]